MNRFVYIVAGVIIINFVFSVLPYMFPRAQKEVLLPYQVWFNVLFIFAIILPSSVGNFKLLFN